MTAGDNQNLSILFYTRNVTDLEVRIICEYVGHAPYAFQGCDLLNNEMSCHYTQINYESVLE